MSISLSTLEQMFGSDQTLSSEIGTRTEKLFTIGNTHFDREEGIGKIIESFTIEGTRELEVDVGSGKYKTALLLHRIGECSDVELLADDFSKVTFAVTGQMQDLIHSFMGDEIVCDALSSEGEEHSAVYALLDEPSEGEVLVTIKYRRQ